MEIIWSGNKASPEPMMIKFYDAYNVTKQKSFNSRDAL